MFSKASSASFNLGTANGGVYPLSPSADKAANTCDVHFSHSSEVNGTPR